jgi:hypothetical protein
MPLDGSLLIIPVRIIKYIKVSCAAEAAQRSAARSRNCELIICLRLLLLFLDEYQSSGLETEGTDNSWLLAYRFQ